MVFAGQRVFESALAGLPFYCGKFGILAGQVVHGQPGLF
jgi:hypothetical protein